MKEFYRQETSRILAIQKILSTSEMGARQAIATPFTVKELTVATVLRCRAQQGVGGGWSCGKLWITRWKFDSQSGDCGNRIFDYAVAPKRTETSLETPGSCMVTP